MEIGRWYKHKTRTYELPVKIISIGDGNVKFLGAEPIGSGIFNMRLESFEAHYDEYEGNLGEEYSIDVLSAAMIRYADTLANYVDGYDFYNKKQKETEQEIRKLQRENRILKVLVEGKRQTAWQKGEIIPGRVAMCSACSKLIISETTLPFFRQKNDKDTDEYYCGCRGFE